MATDEERIADLDRQIEAAKTDDAVSDGDFDDLLEQRVEVRERIAAAKPAAAPTPTASTPTPTENPGRIATPFRPRPAAEQVAAKVNADHEKSGRKIPGKL